MMNPNPIGLYVHIPYCVRKCAYCDFCSIPSGGSVPESYIDRVIEEVLGYKEEGKRTVSTLYFGGGTPSLLTAKQLDRLLSALNRTFDFTPDFEFTLEANPGTLKKEKLCGFHSLGVNRISMGMQSIHENELKILGRIHTYDDFLHSYSMVRDAGISNVNIDLMYGIPEQTIDSFSKTLDAVLALSPEHISAYGLIIEEGTPFYRMRENLSLPTEETECDMYDLACDRLRAFGYRHYEISNYAKCGFESRHNLKYWRDEEYIGIGAAAHSYFGGRRYGNTDDLNEYIVSHKPQYISESILTPEDEMYEYAMMRLRLSEGFSLLEYRERFGVDFLDGKGELLSSLVSMGLFKLTDDRIALTERGFYLSNSILVQIL